MARLKLQDGKSQVQRSGCPALWAGLTWSSCCNLVLVPPRDTESPCHLGSLWEQMVFLRAQENRFHWDIGQTQLCCRWRHPRLAHCARGGGGNANSTIPKVYFLKSGLHNNANGEKITQNSFSGRPRVKCSVVKNGVSWWLGHMAPQNGHGKLPMAPASQQP